MIIFMFILKPVSEINVCEKHNVNDNVYALHSRVYEHVHGSDSHLSEVLHRLVFPKQFRFFVWYVHR